MLGSPCVRASRWYAKRVTKKRKKRQLRLPTYGMHMDTYFGRQLIVTFITIFFFFYPSVVHALMTIFNCQDVNTRISTNPLAASGPWLAWCRLLLAVPCPFFKLERTSARTCLHQLSSHCLTSAY